ncbi:MAG: 2-amino-4-hydroxy-6-hydroxymethyldihydropteridine diphosphokinase FolK [Rhodobacteraceae bacterium HLUCCA12]|nr:MAG: 2-amino-4-hydroxy-6-hydroxymethyldihydropteridine diphosphokinase FolK [Rhodobacteraceae bacterium HLUCCA12]
MQIANCNCFLIALGANLGGTPEKNASVIYAAIGMIAAAGIKVTRTSNFWQTPAYPADSGPDFVNACACVDSDLEPDMLLAVLHEVEARLGRVRRVRWGARAIDIDLLAAGSRILPDAVTLRSWMDLGAADQRRLAPDRLILPHPRLHERAFVLVPLAQIAPDWVHPVLKKSARELEQALDPAEKAQIRPI